MRREAQEIELGVIITPSKYISLMYYLFVDVVYLAMFVLFVSFLHLCMQVISPLLLKSSLKKKEEISQLSNLPIPSFVTKHHH